MLLFSVLVICVLPDRKPVLSEKQLRELKSVKGALLHMFSPFHVPKIRRVKYMIGLAAAAFLLIITARVGIDKVIARLLLISPLYRKTKQFVVHFFYVVSIIPYHSCVFLQQQ